MTLYLKDRPATDECRCVTCGECRGLGLIRVPTKGYPEWDLETCPGCDGHGITELCDQCREINEREQDFRDSP